MLILKIEFFLLEFLPLTSDRTQRQSCVSFAPNIVTVVAWNPYLDDSNCHHIQFL